MLWTWTACPQALPRRSDAGTHAMGVEASCNLESAPTPQPLLHQIGHEGPQPPAPATQRAEESSLTHETRACLGLRLPESQARVARARVFS